MPVFEHRGVQLHYVDSGAGDPLIFLHGLGGSSGQILSTYEPIADRRLIAPDQQAHGKSGVRWEGLGFDALADDVIALADRLGLQHFQLAGISMGAAVAVDLALRHPGRLTALALIRPAWTHLPMSDAVRHHFRVCADYLRRADKEGYQATDEYRELSGISAYTANAFLANFDDPASLAHPDKFLVLPADAPFSAQEALAGIRLPTLILANRKDMVHPFAYGAYYQRSIPGAVLLEIPDKDSDPAGHKRQLNAFLSDFLERR